MPTIARNPRSRTTPAPRFSFPDWDTPFLPQGPEGQVLAHALVAIWMQVCETEWFAELLRTGGAAETYHPVPPRQSYIVPVRYEFRGRGKPLPYRLDEE
jgi:hypothetical protein